MDYKLFAIPIIIMIINQLIKIIIEMGKGKLSWSSIFSYGGMPSSHSAIVVSLATMMGYYRGITSPEFAITVIIALLTIRDAAGIRWQLGNHGKMINQLVKELPDKKEYRFPVLNERFGHKNIEVMIGALFGLGLTWLAIWLIP